MAQVTAQSPGAYAMKARTFSAKSAAVGGIPAARITALGPWGVAMGVRTFSAKAAATVTVNRFFLESRISNPFGERLIS